jgi:HAE1 family hydrophobic/amphiphilic exporter-1
MVMASLFESFLHPFVMIFAIPFAAIGVVGSLLLTNTTLNVFSFMGIIVLTGVVVNNAIVLVDYINLLRREEQRPLFEAVVAAAKRRIRPILMTTLTTALALTPVAIGLQEGNELQAPLARVVVGGLATSALITLVFVPTLYHTLERLRERWRHRKARSSTA